MLPTGCRQRPDIVGECNASPDADTVVILSLLNSMIIPAASLIVAVAILSILMWRIVAKERIFSSKIQKDSRDYEGSNNEVPLVDEEENLSVEEKQVKSPEKQELSLNDDGTKSPCLETPETSSGAAASTSLRRRSTFCDTDETATNMAVAYRQEMIAQLLLYSSSLLLVYLIYISAVAIVLGGKHPHHVHYSFAQFLFPLQGLFNIIIYLRPAARITRIRREGSSWIEAYYLVIKNGGEALKEEVKVEQMIKMKLPTSVKFGVEHIPKDSCADVCSNECMYVNSSEQLSRDNAAFNSSQDWHHIVGSEGSSAQEPQDIIACIHHNDLEMIAEESDVDSQQLVSSETVSRE